MSFSNVIKNLNNLADESSNDDANSLNVSIKGILMQI